MAIHDVHSQVTVVDRYREYSKVDTYLAGLIKVHRIIDTEKRGQDVHIRVPVEAQMFDKFYVNGQEFVPKSDRKRGDEVV